MLFGESSSILTRGFPDPAFPMRRDRHPSPQFPASRCAYSLIELLAVMGVAALLLAIAAPSFVSFNPARKTGIHELAGFLGNARAEAIARGAPRIIAFADETFPGENDVLRAYALFEEAPSDGEPGETPRYRRLSPWRTLPRGLVFARGTDFAVTTGEPFRTLHDLAREHAFPVPGPAGSEGGAIPLPALMFGPDGGVRSPGFENADALHLAIIEGFHDAKLRRVVPTTPRSSGGGAALPRGECLGVGYYTGRTGILTD